MNCVCLCGLCNPFACQAVRVRSFDLQTINHYNHVVTFVRIENVGDRLCRLVMCKRIAFFTALPPALGMRDLLPWYSQEALWVILKYVCSLTSSSFLYATTKPLFGGTKSAVICKLKYFSSSPRTPFQTIAHNAHKRMPHLMLR